MFRFFESLEIVFVFLGHNPSSLPMDLVSANILLRLLKRNFTALNKYHKNGLSLEVYFNQFLHIEFQVEHCLE